MRKLTVRLPAALVADIETESQQRGLSRSAIVRERLQRERIGKLPPHLDDIADVIGCLDDDLPADLSARKKHYLRLWGLAARAGALSRSGAVNRSVRQLTTIALTTSHEAAVGLTA